jgi:molybdate transport system regulatory protein
VRINVTIPRIRFRIDFGRAAAVGPGKIALLEQIQGTGSLSQAARELKMSYRRAWLLLDSLNNSFEERVVSSSIGGRHGGGAELTPFGRSLILAYRRFESSMQRQAERHFRSLAVRLDQGHKPPRTQPKVRLSAR